MYLTTSYTYKFSIFWIESRFFPVCASDDEVVEFAFCESCHGVVSALHSSCSKQLQQEQQQKIIYRLKMLLISDWKYKENSELQLKRKFFSLDTRLWCSPFTWLRLSKDTHKKAVAANCKDPCSANIRTTAGTIMAYIHTTTLTLLKFSTFTKL